MATMALTLRDRARRADEIVAERARGAEWAEIAARHSISARQAQRIHSAGSARTPVLDTDPIALACAVLADYDDALEDLRQLASETSHDGTKLGAIRGRVEVITLRTQLQMALGLLPPDLGDLALVVDGRRTAEAVLGVLERFNASDEMWEAMEAAFGVGP
jgi:hypothetical protein